MRRSLLVGSFLLGSLVPFVVACGASGSPPSSNAEALACRYGESVADDPTPYVAEPPATAGQPTEAFAQAKRLFESERWVEALPAFQRVTSGESSDDEGNRQLAEYYLAVTFTKLKQSISAMDAFEPLAKNPSHLKHKETAMWLVHLATDPLATERAVDALYLYTDRDLAAYDNPAQRDELYLMQLARARAAYRKGRYDEALSILVHVRAYAPLRRLADGCGEARCGGEEQPSALRRPEALRAIRCVA